MPVIIYCWEWEPDDGPIHKVFLEVDGTVTPFCPALINGPLESCRPDEGGDVEVDSVNVLEVEVEGDQIMVDADLRGRLETLFWLALDRDKQVKREVDYALFEAHQYGG